MLQVSINKLHIILVPTFLNLSINEFLIFTKEIEQYFNVLLRTYQNPINLIVAFFRRQQNKINKLGVVHVP
jgi:hypothetical protein